MNTVTPPQSSKPRTPSGPKVAALVARGDGTFDALAGRVRLDTICAACSAPLAGWAVRLKWQSVAGAWSAFRYHPGCATRAANNLFAQHVGRDVRAVVFLDA